MSRSRHYVRRKGPLYYEFCVLWRDRRDDERTGLRRVRIRSARKYKRTNLFSIMNRAMHEQRMLARLPIGTTNPHPGIDYQSGKSAPTSSTTGS